jgi:murein DD-endopeptidase MepM/ murein hydrolase activator NlpD
MSVGEWLRSASGPRAYALVLTLFGVAACSGDASRLSDNPSAARMGPETTGTISQAQATSARVETRPLPPQTAQVTPVSLGGGRSGIAGGGKGLASYTPSASAGTPVESTSSIAPPKPPAPSGHWSWDGGHAVTVAPGDTIETIAHRYGVPAAAIAKTNNLSAQQSLRPGQQLVIPRYVQGSHSLAAPKTVAAATPLGSNGVHVVAAGETLSKISRTYGTPVADIAKANNLDVNARLSVGDRLIIPGRSSAARGNASAPTIAEHKNVEIASAAEPQENASVYKEVPVAAEGKDSTKSAEATGSLPKFRWPANGRIISAYGPTTNGQQNDGINIAVPENTPVKAAEDGVVAYAGSELKGYGNLVLVRHPNGYVTAYAHAKELLVKRGDQVKRGQVIARSGQSGNVNAPQLHFEIRKGASPLDPTKFLNGA